MQQNGSSKNKGRKDSQQDCEGMDAAAKGPLAYTRKRALLACDFCRHRKRRCDGEKPCSTCRESGVTDCHYKDLPVDRVDVSTTPATGDFVAERLDHIEALLQAQSQSLSELAAAQQGHSQGLGGLGGYGGGGGGGNWAPPFQPNLFSLPASYSYQPPPHHSSHSDQPSQHRHPHDHLMVPATLDPQVDHSQFLIPTDHFTAASSLLALPRVRTVVGDYPKNFFHDIEDSLPLPEPLDMLRGTDLAWPALNIETLDSLARNYFAAVHPNYPLFTPQDFARWRGHIFENGLTETPETAICLCVWALGSVVPAVDEPVPVPAAIQEEKDRLGLSFFQPALRLVLGWSVWGFKPTMTICQALLMAASYFAHIGRPLHSWKMVYFASLKFMFLHDKQKRTGAYGYVGQDSNYLRVFWTCFMIECDRAAELDVPRSGIEPMADRMPLARSLTPDEHEELIYFVAETAVRRLLNRVHSSLYSSENSDLILFADSGTGADNLSLNKLLNVSSELNRQLDEWYMSVPENLRPPLGNEPVASDRGKVLRIRYYAARHIIHRPFVLWAALQQQQATSRATSVGSSPVSPHLSAAATATQGPSSSAAAAAGNIPIQIPPIVLKKCEVCLETCQIYLRNSAEMLDKRTPYLWTFSQTSMAQFLVLLACESIPQLARFTTELKPLLELLVPKLRRWATPGSSFEAEVRIIERILNRDNPRERSAHNTAAPSSLAESVSVASV